MQKPKSNAHWTELSDEKLQTLDKWLFDEKLSYAVILPRAQAELGYKGQMTSLKRYFLRRRKHRVTEEFKDLRDELAAISDAPADAASLRLGSMKLLATFLFQHLRRSPENVKEMAAIANVIVQNDRNEVVRETKAEEQKLWRELKAEDQKIRREAMAFTKEKFQFDAIEMAMKMLPQLRELEEARKDPKLKDYEENAMINKFRREAFGIVWEGLPESAKEEEEMLAAMKERQAQSQRKEEARKNRERITEPEPLTPSSPHYEEYLEWQRQEAAENWANCPEYEI